MQSLGQMQHCQSQKWAQIVLLEPHVVYFNPKCPQYELSKTDSLQFWLKSMHFCIMKQMRQPFTIHQIYNSLFSSAIVICHTAVKGLIVLPFLLEKP